MNAFKVVEDFENAVAEYTGAPYCVAVNSCTNALFLCLEWQKYRNQSYYDAPDWTPRIPVFIPKHTYIGVAQAIKNAGYALEFKDSSWEGSYELAPHNIWDCAKRFTSDMWIVKKEATKTKSFLFMCTSHHWTKILGIQQGGCILCEEHAAYRWLRKARFDGRTPGLSAKDEKSPVRGWHMYMSPEVAAEGLVRLMHLPKHNPDQPTDGYPDLSQFDIFK